MDWRRLSVLFAGLLVLAAYGGWLMAEEETREAEDENEEVGSVLAVFEVLASDLVSARDALAAIPQADAGIPVELELSVARSTAGAVVVWEVEFVAGDEMHEVIVDAKTGKVLSRESEKDTEEAQAFRALHREGTTSLGKILANLEELMHGQVVAVGLDDEDGGAAVWEAIVVHDGRVSEVEIRADTGKIVPGGDDDDDEVDPDEDDDEVEEDDD